VQLHELLTKSAHLKPVLLPSSGDVKFPEPVFPQRPELLKQSSTHSGVAPALFLRRSD
jgi:hypothetical protein